jgi:putative effector of murein hydrolase
MRLRECAKKLYCDFVSNHCFFNLCKQIIKILVTVVVGFVYSALTTVVGVAAVQKITGTGGGKAAQTKVVKAVNNNKGKNGVSTPPPPPKPFSDETWNLFWIGTVSSGILSLLATKTSFEYSTLLQTIFLTFVTGASYIWSARLPAAFVKVIHPLVTSSILILASIRGVGLVTGVEFLDVLRSYKTGKLFPLQKTGAGDLLMYSLGPSVVSFAVAMFGRRQLLSANLLGVATAMLIASFGGLFGTAFFVKLIGIGGSAKNGALIRLSLIARNITTALALPLTAMLGGDLSIAAAVVCLTGILGASYGKLVLNALNINDPLLRGLAIGSSAQGLGVASMVDEVDAFPFAAIAMVLTAVAGTTLAAIPSIQKALIDAAT